ncbi:MAG: hypothetical protein M1840_002719 [Geoglossum simile]|nr:MAG: hypothetical protein M1840_002719 [Geoglossum simile]
MPPPASPPLASSLSDGPSWHQIAMDDIGSLDAGKNANENASENAGENAGRDTREDAGRAASGNEELDKDEDTILSTTNNEQEEEEEKDTMMYPSI